jgi:hypothetical protein
MDSTAIKQRILDSPYQNKVEDKYPEVEISSDMVRDLRTKNINEIFSMNIVVRVVGITERDIGGGKKHHFFNLEIREAGATDKTPDEMTPEEILKKVEEKQQ